MKFSLAKIAPNSHFLEIHSKRSQTTFVVRALRKCVGFSKVFFVRILCLRIKPLPYDVQICKAEDKNAKTLTIMKFLHFLF